MEELHGLSGSRLNVFGIAAASKSTLCHSNDGILAFGGGEWAAAFAGKAMTEGQWGLSIMADQFMLSPADAPIEAQPQLGTLSSQ